jgi:hypothetical protein
MSSFLDPLYSSLCRETENKGLTKTQKTKFVEIIKKLDKKGFELVYALIRVYHMDTGNPGSFIIPYKGRKLQKGIKFDLQSLPDKLQQILFLFVEKHREKMKEEQKLSKQRF